MADNKTFTIAGTSTKDGANTFRFATGKATVRTGVLKRNGHTDIALQDLPQPMTKTDAIAFLGKSGITAVVPKSGRKAAVVQTPEQIAEAAEAAKKEARNAARRLARASAKKGAAVEGDASFIAGTADELLNAEPDAEVVRTVTEMEEAA